jgi:hypothetical protein
MRGSFPAIAFASLLFASACSSGNGSNHSAPPPPRELTARPAGGSPGIGPVSVSPSPGGKDHRQQVVLDDRVLIVSGATVRTAVGAGSSLVAVDVTIQSRGPEAIANNADSFEIMGAEGDIFAKQQITSNSFYGTIAPHASRAGKISFEIPKAATSTMRLLYRPGADARTVIVPLTVS